MARRKPAHTPPPRNLNAFQVACRLGMCETTFRQRRPWLEEALGFPKRDEDLGGWDAKAIEEWFDDRSGLRTGLTALSDSDPLMEALHDS